MPFLFHLLVSTGGFIAGLFSGESTKEKVDSATEGGLKALAVIGAVAVIGVGVFVWKVTKK